FEIGFDRALPCRLELKIERARRRVDEAVEEIALGNFAAPLGEHRPGTGFCSCARRLSFAFARFGSLGHLRSAPKSLHRPFRRKQEPSLTPPGVPAFGGTKGTAFLHPLREGRVGMAARRSRVYCACGETRISSVGPCSTMRPACMTMTRSHNNRTTLRSWETNRELIPSE